MTEHPNSHLTRRMVDAFSRGDLDTVGGCFSPDAVWDLPGRSTVAGTYKGPAGDPRVPGQGLRTVRWHPERGSYRRPGQRLGRGPGPTRHRRSRRSSPD